MESLRSISLYKKIEYIPSTFDIRYSLFDIRFYINLAKTKFDGLAKSLFSVSPAEAGVQNLLKLLDSGVRQNDKKLIFRTNWPLSRTAAGLITDKGRVGQTLIIHFFALSYFQWRGSTGRVGHFEGGGVFFIL